MALLHYLWSRVAASNATADANVNWQEGQAPSTVNDSARAMMASAAAFRDDIAGAIVTGGTSTAYTINSYQVFDTLAHMDKMLIAFTPHATNGATVTLNVDGLGAKPLRSSPSVELPAGSLILGTPYVALYNNSDAVWYLHCGVGAANAYSIPLLGGMDYWDTVTPNSSFIFPIGQAISRTTYASAFARWGTTYGVGDGSTTFNVPNKAGRVSAMKESGGSLLTSTYFGGNSATIGAIGGFEAQALTANLIPTLTSASSGALSVSVTGAEWQAGSSSDSTGVNPPGGGGGAGLTSSLTGGSISKKTASGSTSGALTSTTSGTGGAAPAHPIVQPTIICNYIIRVL